jgi:type IV pilus assembly protein PilV
MTTSRRASRGFTLVEVLMAMLIMTVGLLGLLQSVMVAYERSVGNRLREAALLIGEEQMHLLRRMPLPATTAYTNITTVVRGVAGAAKTFIITRDSQPMHDTLRLRVRVGWTFKNTSTTHSIYTLKKI